MNITTRFFTSLFLLTLFLLPAAGAWATTAGTAANTQIINTATLTSGGVTVASSTVIVSVALIPSQPNISINPGSAAYLGLNSPAITDSVIILTTANGPASYTITTAIVAGFSNSGGGGNNPSIGSGASTTITLGASITTGTSTTTYFTVPCFPYANDAPNNNANQINGIGVNDTIVFTVGGVTYTRQVTAVNNPGTTGGTATITFDGAPLPTAAGPGTPIYEKQTVNVTVLPGQAVTSGVLTPIKVDVLATGSTAGVADITANTSSSGVALSTPNIWSTPQQNVSVTKYVRNLTAAGNAAGTSPTNFTITGTSPVFTATNTFYRGGVTAKSGDVLEYVVEASNTGTSPADDLSSSSISDFIPTSFATFLPGQYVATGGRDIWYITDTGAETWLTAGATGQATYIAANNPNLVVNVGQGAGSGTPGVLPGGKKVRIFYQVTVK